VPLCRRFATQTREVRTGTPAAGETMTTCAFDSTQIALTCTTFDAGGNSSTSTVTRWASVEDAVAHNVPIGLSSAQRVSSLRGPCTITQEYRYDAQARLTTIQSSVDTAACGSFSAVYDSWDSRKRPLTGTMTGVGTLAGCTGQKVTRDIDDARGSLTVSYRQGAGCSDGTVVQSYDAEGILLSLQADSPSGQQTVTHTILATSTICR
jgi:hypothetical protein